MAGASGSPAERINLLNLAGHAPKLATSATTLTADGSTLAWDAAQGAFTLVPGGGGGGGAPADATFVTLSANAGLTAERVLAAGAGLTLVDGGANSNVTLSVSVPNEAQGDLLVRGAQSWTRLAAGAAGRVLQSGGSGQIPSYVQAPLHQPMVWSAQRVVTKRDGVLVLAAVPWSPADYPQGRSIYLQSVLAVSGNWQVRVRLYNATDAEYVVGGTVSGSSGSPTAATSAALTVGTQSGNLRTTSRVYELHADIVGASSLDNLGVVGFAGLRIE